MGKDNESRIGIGINSPSDEIVDPNDPVYWDEATLRENAKEWVFEQQGRYRGDPESLDMVLTDEQQRIVVDHVVKYWIPKDIDGVARLAGEVDKREKEDRTGDAAETEKKPKTPKKSYEKIIRDSYKNSLTSGLSQREALSQVKNIVASRLSTYDLNGLPDIAAIHARQIINQFANFKPRPPQKPNPYSTYL